MATEQVDNVPMEVQSTPPDNKQDDVVSIDLPAPTGWTKKFIPKKGGTPRRNEIVFIAPTGEDIKTKRQLDQYLKSHSGGPAASEFDWGTGDTPRRSSRLSSKPKARETPERGSSRKKQKKSNSKEEEKKEDTDGEGGSAEDEAPADKSEAEKDVEMKEAEVAGNHPEAEKVEEAPIYANPAEASVDNAEVKTDETMKQEADSNVVSVADGKLEEERPEGDLKVELPHEAAPVNGESELDGKADDNPSEVRLPENDNAVKDQPAKNEEEPAKQLPEVQVQPAENEEEPAKQLPEVQVQPEVAPMNTVQSVDEAPAATAGMGIDNSEPGQKDLEKVVSSEKIEPDGNNAKGNQEAADHSDNKPVNAGNAAHEPSAAPPITC